MYLALFRAKICPECGIWPKGVAERGSRTKGGTGGVRPKAEKKSDPHYFDGATDHSCHGNGQ